MGTQKNKTQPPSGKGPGASNQSTGSCQGKCPLESNKGVIVYCEHEKEHEGVKQKRRYDQPTQHLHIVQTKQVDEVTIFSKDPNSPRELTVLRLSDNTSTSIKGSSAKGGKEYKFKASYHPPEAPYLSGSKLFKSLITYYAEPTEYVISGLDSPIYITAHNPDQWKLSLSVPPFESYKVGRVLDNKKTTQVQIQGQATLAETKVNKVKYSTTERKNWKSSKSTDITESYEKYCAVYASPDLFVYGIKDQTVLSGKDESKATKLRSDILKSINLQRNKTDFIPDSVDLILSAINLALRIQGMVKKFKDVVPKIGWYITFELKILSGTFELAWGWREHTDWRSFYYLGATVKTTLFEIVFEAGFGIDVIAFSAQVCFQCKGSVELTLPALETTGPTEEAFYLGTIEGLIEGGIFARVEVGYFLNCEGKGVTGIKASGRVFVTPTREIKVSCENTWTGVVISYKASLAGYGVSDGTRTLVEPVEMEHFEFPAPAPHPRRELGPMHVEDAILDRLKAGWFNNKVAQYPGGEEVPLEHVAKLFKDKIFAHKKSILLDEKTVDGITHAIQKKLDGLEKQAMKKEMERDKGFWDPITGDYNGADLNDVVLYRDNEFLQVLKDAEDPFKKNFNL